MNQETIFKRYIFFIYDPVRLTFTAVLLINVREQTRKSEYVAQLEVQVRNTAQYILNAGRTIHCYAEYITSLSVM
jgi:hypothetical protein